MVLIIIFELSFLNGWDGWFGRFLLKNFLNFFGIFWFWVVVFLIFMLMIVGSIFFSIGVRFGSVVWSGIWSGIDVRVGNGVERVNLIFNVNVFNSWVCFFMDVVFVFWMNG